MTMSWIKMIDENEANGRLKEVYKKITGPKKSKVANVLKVQSLNAKILDAHLGLYKSIMYGKSNLTRRQREMAAVIVSKANECHY